MQDSDAEWSVASKASNTDEEKDQDVWERSLQPHWVFLLSTSGWEAPQNMPLLVVSSEEELLALGPLLLRAACVRQ